MPDNKATEMEHFTSRSLIRKWITSWLRNALCLEALNRDDEMVRTTRVIEWMDTM